MDIRHISEEEKERYIERCKVHFGDLRKFLNDLEINMGNKELEIQASAVWISGQLCNWWADFMTQIRKLNDVKTLQEEIKEIMENENTTH